MWRRSSEALRARGVLPEALEHCRVAGLAGTEDEQLDPVRARLETACDLRRDAHDVPPLEVVRLALERDAPGAVQHDVELLLPLVPVPERLAEVRSESLVAETALLRVRRLPAEARLDVR